MAASNRVDLEQSDGVADHEVDARKVTATERGVRGAGDLLHARGNLVGKRSRALVHAAASRVARREVVPVRGLGEDLGHRTSPQPFGGEVEHSAGDLAPWGELLAQHDFVVRERVLDRLDQRILARFGAHARDADGGALRRRLDDHGRPQVIAKLTRGALQVGSCPHDVLGCDRKIGSRKALLRGDLAHAECACEHARTHVGHAHDLQQPLKASVFAEPSVRGREHDFVASLHEAAGQRSSKLQQLGLVACLLQGRRNACGRSPRYFRLGRGSALNDCNLHVWAVSLPPSRCLSSMPSSFAKSKMR